MIWGDWKKTVIQSAPCALTLAAWNFSNKTFGQGTNTKPPSFFFWFFTNNISNEYHVLASYFYSLLFRYFQLFQLEPRHLTFELDQIWFDWQMAQSNQWIGFSDELLSAGFYIGIVWFDSFYIYFLLKQLTPIFSQLKCGPLSRSTNDEINSINYEGNNSTTWRSLNR